MQLLRLEVQNWVHHRHQICEFTRGLVAILGENGSGKSSLFGAIKWLLTGENPNYGVKADNISQYAKEGEPSFARLEFEHNGHIAVVTRHLLPDKEPSTLTLDDKEIARGDKAVTAGIEKILCVDAKFISRFIIVGQMDIFSFIDDNQTDTDKFFQRLFNTVKADKCQDAIGKFTTKLSVPEIIETADQIEIARSGVLQQIETLREQIGNLPSFDTFLAAQKTHQKTITDWETRAEAANSLAALERKELEYNRRLTTVDETVKRYAADLDALDGAVNGQDSAYADARSALAHWESYKKVAAARALLQKDSEEIFAQRAADAEPRVVSDKELEESSALVLRLRAEVEQAENLLSVFDQDGVVACPTCHTPAKNLHTHLTDTRNRLPQLSADLTAAKTVQQQILSAQQTHAAWVRREQSRQTKLQQIESSVVNLTTIVPPKDAEEKLLQAVNEYEDFKKLRHELAPLAQEAREERATLAGQIAAIQSQRDELTDVIARITVTQTDEFLARTLLENLKSEFATRQEIERQITELEFTARQLAEKQNQAAADEQRAVKLREWLEIAGQSREALKNAPRLVAQRNLQRLESAVNDILQIFAVNFSVRVATDGSLTFLAEFFDGRKQVAQRLSVGQKTVLALAFRVACNAMFAEEIGLLALDEPTASLDAPRIRALAPVLEKLRDLSTAKGLQCLLVTHATGLSHLFESSITLEPPEVRNVSTRR